ncbi:hypothetical protein HDU98_004950 [Podochytrium sp. JEL0797]|nr:hypothetical protein HDU98_004950 [Podochytrium sp. JEL0797]
MEDPKGPLEEGAPRSIPTPLMCPSASRILAYPPCAESHHCHGFQEKLAACGERVEAGEEQNCVEEFFELMECVDHCAAPQLFKQLK